MYEFDEDGWDEQEAEIDELREVREGWLIQKITRSVELPQAEDRLEQARFLQIGTGQWCAVEYATLFPVQSTAVVYAREFGYLIGRDVRIVHHRW